MHPHFSVVMWLAGNDSGLFCVTNHVANYWICASGVAVASCKRWPFFQTPPSDPAVF